MAALQHLLFVPSRARALSLVLRQPQLLSYSSETLKTHLEALRAALRVSTDMALLLVARHPNLLCFSPEAIQVRWEAGLICWWRTVQYGSLQRPLDAAFAIVIVC